MRLSFDARARAILRRLPVVNVYSAAELALLAALAVQGARLVWAIVTPIAPLGAWQPAAVVTPADPAALFATFDPFNRSGTGTTAPAAVTSLQLTLFGTRMDLASGAGSAIIAGPDGVQQSVAVGGEVAPGVTLKAVAFDHVTLDRGGVSEDLFLDQSGGGATVSPPAVGASPTSTGAPPAPPSAAQLRQEISAMPRIDGGRISGVTLRAQGAGDAFRAAGLRDGDVVTAIAGRPIAGIADVERLSQAGSGPVQLTIERGGQTMPLSVAVAP